MISWASRLAAVRRPDAEGGAMQNENGANPFDELYRRISITARVRFVCSRRLAFSHNLSQWTIALASIGLIALSLMQITQLAIPLSRDALAVLQIFFAVVVLAFSLLIGYENLNVRADRMHRCGLELAKIFRALEPFRDGQASDRKYRDFCSRYDATLDKFDNHDAVDFTLFTFTRKSEYYPSFLAGVPGIGKLLFQLALTYMLYILVLFLSIAVVWAVLASGPSSA